MSRNTTGHRGVNKKGKNLRKNFTAQIYINGKDKHLGIFTHARDAANAFTITHSSRPTVHTHVNFPAGMPIEDQLPNEDGIWL
jgi:hypothetical protein